MNGKDSTPEQLENAMKYGICRTCKAPREPYLAEQRDEDGRVIAASLTTEDIFDMVREYRGAPSNTASAMTVEEWREAWLAEWQRANRAEVAVEEIMAALRSMRELASVAHNGDPWYAENEGLDAGAIFKQAREALGEPDA